MELADLTKDLRRFLLSHWTEREVVDSLQNPEYFFEQIVIPRLDYLRRQGEDVPRIRFSRTPKGEPRLLITR